MYKKIYRTVWRQQEVEFKDMDWDTFVNDTFNYLCSFSGQGFIETDQEFVLKSEAEKYVKKYPVRITRLQGYFLVRWMELYEVAFNDANKNDVVICKVKTVDAQPKEKGSDNFVIMVAILVGFALFFSLSIGSSRRY